MPETTPKNKLFFDFYENIKNDTEILSIEDLEIAIKTLELAKEQLKSRERKRIQKMDVEALKCKMQNENPCGKTIYLPKNLKRLNANAFKGDKEIVKVVINERLTEIGEYAFEDCTNLKEVVFPKNKILLRRGCFKGCTSLKEIIIHEVSNICPSAFENCTALERVIFSWKVSNIYSKAFKNCYSLKDVCFKTHPANCITVYSKTFENCFSLESISFPQYTSVDFESFVNCSKLKEIYIRDNWIFRKSFKDCDAKIIKI